MLPSSMILEEYLHVSDESPFARWFEDLDTTAAAKVTVALSRIERGAVSK